MKSIIPEIKIQEDKKEIKSRLVTVKVEEIKLEQWDTKSDEKKSLGLETTQTYIDSLIQFAQRVRNSTCYPFGNTFLSTFSSQRKDQGLDIIIDKLKAARLKNEAIDPIKTLSAIIHNAMQARSSKKTDVQTESGLAVVKLLHQSEFELLKDLLTAEIESLTYKGLKSFAQKKISAEIEGLEPYHYIIKSSGIVPPPKFEAITLPVIADPDDEKTKARFSRNEISIIKKNNGQHELVFFNTILNKFQIFIISKDKDNELNSFLGTIKAGQLLNDPKSRFKILEICASYGATPYTQRQLINIFQNLLYWLHEFKPDLAKIYQLPKALTAKQLRGRCYGLGVAFLNKNHRFSELLSFACSLELESLQNLIKNGAIVGFENFPLEDFLLAYKKIHGWHDTGDLGIEQHHQYRTTLGSFWVNTLTVHDNSSNLNTIFQKILVTTDFWEVVFRLPNDAGHVVFIKRNPDGSFAYHDSNESIVDWFGPFKTLEILSERVFGLYKSEFGNKQLTMTANALQPMVKEDKFDLQIAALDQIFKKTPGAWINNSIKEYLSDKICRTEFARTVIPLLTDAIPPLTNLNPKTKQPLSPQQRTILAAREFFRDFLEDKHNSVQFMNVTRTLSQDFGTFLRRLILLGDWRAAIKIVNQCGPDVYEIALKWAVEFNQFTVIKAFIQRIPGQATGSKNKIFLECFSVVKNVEVAGILLGALGIQAQTEIDVWAQITVFAAKHKDFNLLNRFETNILDEALIKIDKSDLGAGQKQKLRASIEQVFFHKLDNRYPLVPQTWTMSWHGSQSTSTTPSKDSIVAALSEQQRLEHAKILTRFGYGHSEKHTALTPFEKGLNT